MAQFPSMPVFTDSYLGDTTDLSTEEHGAYFLLLLAAWRSPSCILPDDDIRLARTCRCSLRRWQTKLRPVMERFWHIDNGEWAQKKQLKIRKQVAKTVEQKSTAGKASALKRKKTTPTAVPTTKTKTKLDSKESNIYPLPNVDPPPKKKLLTDMADWQPCTDCRAYAEQYNLDPDRIIHDIHDWAANAPPSKRRKKAPDRFWQTWVRREADRPQARQSNKLKFDHL